MTAPTSPLAWGQAAYSGDSPAAALRDAGSRSVGPGSPPPGFVSGRVVADGLA
ncbi:hypothetical protein [Rhodococcus sp. NPDC060176]|uniref:hypothetical protein n=1 Tax=Rhodococcus sp. NPDC060176 TaxID=3347062 RepID=UPI00366250CD